MTTPGPNKPPNTAGEEDEAMFREVMEFQVNFCNQPGDNGNYQLCLQMQDDLLQKRGALDMLFRECEYIMNTECKEYWNQKSLRQIFSKNGETDQDQWDQFIGVAESGQKQLKNDALHPHKSANTGVETSFSIMNGFTAA